MLAVAGHRVAGADQSAGMLEGDTPGYHFPGRDQAVDWSWQQGPAILDEGFWRETAAAITTSCCASARLHQHHNAARSCATQVSWLLRERQLDELHLLVFPVVPGGGKRLLALSGGLFRSRSTVFAGGQEGQDYSSWPAGALVPRGMPRAASATDDAVLGAAPARRGATAVCRRGPRPRQDLVSRSQSLLSGAPGAASSTSGGMHSSPMARSRGPGPAGHCARIGDPRPPGSPAVTATYQRGKHAWPRRPVRPALARDGWPANRRPYGSVRTPGQLCGTRGWPAVTGGTGFSSENPPRRYRMVTLAGWARQPAQSVLRPARGDCPGPVVRLPERRWIRERGLAARHGAPGRRNPDLVTDDTAPGDRNRMNQRIEPHRGPRGLTITVG